MMFHPESLPDLTGRVYIVTGATSGIGFHTAVHLAQHNAHVYICARTWEKGASSSVSIKAKVSHAILDILVMDHTRLSTVITAAKEFLSQQSRLDGLVNNAGTMATPFSMTEDGYEEQWQTNYLAHWVFTHHLLPLMLTTSQRAKQNGAPDGGVRIVNLSSSGHYSAPKGGINFPDTSLKNRTEMERYGQSKLANILHMKMLHKRCGSDSLSTHEVWVSAVHPGLVKSSLGARAELPALMRLPIALYRYMGGALDAEKGSWTSVFCIASPQMKKEDCGKYFQRVADPNGWQSAMAKDNGLAERLEVWTEQEMKRGGWIGD